MSIPVSVQAELHQSQTDVALIPGIAELWAQTLGDSQICVALLDGPVDLSHPSLIGANLTQIDSVADHGPAGRHGTHVASVLFGQHSGPVKGLAPRCRGVSIPVFASAGDGLRSCSQLDLARAISLAVQHGAHLINVSGGQFSPSGSAYPLLANVVRECTRQNVLIVAAAGNEGCDCLHVPAALEAVLAVGALDAHEEPLPFSNWGASYRAQGILAPGERILGARPGGGIALGTGTSYATAVVSGVAALLLGLQRKQGGKPDPHVVRAALLCSALGCDHEPFPDCRRLLAGRLNVNGAVSFIIHHGKVTMQAPPVADAPGSPATLQASPVANAPGSPVTPLPAMAGSVLPSDVQPSACGCATGAPQLVYVLGQLGYDLVSEARLDSLAQGIAGATGAGTAERVSAFDPRKLLAYLTTNPWDAAAVTWTLSLDGTPVYAIRPAGPFAAQTYEELRDFLTQQLDEGVQRVSIPGVIVGKTTLLMGQEVPVIVPELRGMRSWTTDALIAAVVGAEPAARASQEEKAAHEKKKSGVHEFLDRVYHEFRNLGIMPQDRALNFAATNAYEAEKVYESAMKEDMDLDSIHVARSPICRPGSDCWDVELYFFYPERQVQTVRKVYRFTVDVSDVVPVTVGPTRAWMAR